MIKHHKQVSLTDCGHACVKTILSNYGYDINMDNYFNSKSTQGLSLLDIEKILKKYKVKSESYKLDELNKLREIRFPCIAVVKRNSIKNKGKIVCIVTHDSDLLNLASGILDLNLLR
ncbi:MAG: cysteine peptidase family C39 domain-containing protein [Lactobacillus crispatus]|nr:cysteine peptidase family C39 domain-containing protein [Lactobacillus crispatus]